MATEHSSLLTSEKNPQADGLTTLFQPGTPTGSSFRHDEPEVDETEEPTVQYRYTASDVISTVTGSFVFLIYHTVFCLAQAATIAPTAGTTGLMARTAALGAIVAAPVFCYELGSDIPAIYGASDFFLASFLAELADRIHAVLVKRGLDDRDEYFMATFLAVSVFGLVLSGVWCILAARFKLANLGAFLPYSVLCGFFTTIGVLMWTLGFSVDTGMKVGQVLTSNGATVIWTALVHHAPSVVVGVVMHHAGRAHPYFVIFFVFATVMGSYVILWVTGTTIAQAQEAKWFFSSDNLVPTTRTETYGPPMPFGLGFSIWRGEVVWEAFAAGVPTILALAFLYVIRGSLHSAALK